jgi:hypothetical protein
MFNESCRLLAVLEKSLKSIFKESYTIEAGTLYGLGNDRRRSMPA